MCLILQSIVRQCSTEIPAPPPMNSGTLGKLLELRMNPSFGGSKPGVKISISSVLLRTECNNTYSQFLI